MFTHVLYHKACPDGYASAYVTWTKIGNYTEDGKLIKYLPVSYYENVPNIKNGKILVLDFSFSETDTKKLIENNQVFYNIDHHITAIDNLTEIDEKYKYFDIEHSGVMLTWKYFYPDQEPPTFIKYVEDYDLWKFNYEDTRPFMVIFSKINYEFGEVDKFRNEMYLNEMIQKGKIIIEYQDSVIKFQLKHVHVRNEVINNCSYNIAYLNSNYLVNEIGNQCVKSLNCDFSVIYSYDEVKNLTRFSLRSCDNKTDVSEIAKFLKGGGHRNASGISKIGFHNSIIA